MSSVKPPTHKVHDYFVKGYHRPRNHLPQDKGELCYGAEKTQVQFFLNLQNNCIEAVSYKCTTCVVLVAYCEFLSELAHRSLLADVEKIASKSLVSAFPEVPSDRFNRACLAVESLRSAIQACKIRSGKEQTNVPGSGTSEYTGKFASTINY